MGKLDDILDTLDRIHNRPRKLTGTSYPHYCPNCQSPGGWWGANPSSNCPECGRHCVTTAHIDHQNVEETKSPLPYDHAGRKDVPIARGVLDYFPRAIAEVARVSAKGSQQHHPDAEMHWDRSKSTDHADCIVRHLLDRGKLDTDGMRHTAKVAWRALALLEIEMEEGE